MYNSISLKSEIQRKFIHLGSSFIPIVILIVGREWSIVYLGIITPIFILFDLFKSKVKILKKLYNSIFGRITRDNEFDNLTGASFVLIGCFLTLLFFRLEIAVFSMFVMSICDSFAAIIGKSLGKVYIFNKTLEGTIGFIISGFLLLIFIPFIPVRWGVLAIIIASLIELFPYPQINDNLSIPLICSVILNINQGI